MSNNLIRDYSLRIYARGLYPENAGKRGGSIFNPFFKKDIKPFQTKVRYAVNMSRFILEKAKYPFSSN